ncbi:MAG: IclR family transcriptional regulator [Burkholderiales bacterium]|nr:IclR family transcriptional regulator [Burkholderiales bacterium]
MQPSLASLQLEAAVSRSDPAPMALARVLRALRVLADEPDGLTLAQLMVQLGAPKTSVHSLLRGLTAEGYLQRHDTAYRLGPESFVLGAALVAARSLAIVATPYLLDARAQSGETVLLAVIDRAAGRLTYTQIVESHKPVRYTVPVGTTRPLFAASAGRVLLAFQDDAWRRDYLKTADLRALTDRTVTDRRQLARVLDRVRAAGFASTVGEVTPDVAGFAAPVFEPTGQVNAALIVAAPIERGRAAAERLTRIAVETAQLLSQALGHRADQDNSPQRMNGKA